MAQHTPATSRAGTFGAILRVTSGNFLEQFDFFLVRILRHLYRQNIFFRRKANLPH